MRIVTPYYNDEKISPGNYLNSSRSHSKFSSGIITKNSPAGNEICLPIANDLYAEPAIMAAKRRFIYKNTA